MKISNSINYMAMYVNVLFMFKYLSGEMKAKRTYKLSTKGLRSNKTKWSETKGI